jgi:hypothetical protein
MIWSNTLVLALMLLGALAYGFTGHIPQFKDRRAKGALLFSVGVAAVFVPPQFALAAILIGIGTRMVWDDRDDNGPGQRGSVEDVQIRNGQAAGTAVVKAERSRRRSVINKEAV